MSLPRRTTKAPVAGEGATDVPAGDGDCVVDDAHAVSAAKPATARRACGERENWRMEEDVGGRGEWNFRKASGTHQERIGSASGCDLVRLRLRWRDRLRLRRELRLVHVPL